MICKLGGFITQRHKELRDIEAEFLSMVCSDVEIEPVLQNISVEHLNRGSNKAQDAKLDIRARVFWEQRRSVFFDVRVCHPNAVSYRDLGHNKFIVSMRTRKSVSSGHRAWNIYTFGLHHNWRNGKECLMYHSRLAQLIAIKKGEKYAKTNSWIRTNTSFALMRSALVCLRGSRTRRVLVPCDIKNVEIHVEVLLKEPFNRTIDVFPELLLNANIR